MIDEGNDEDNQYLAEYLENEEANISQKDLMKQEKVL